jgi:hypothetical protein
MERTNLALFDQKENRLGLLTYDFLRISNGRKLSFGTKNLLLGVFGRGSGKHDKSGGIRGAKSGDSIPDPVFPLFESEA